MLKSVSNGTDPSCPMHRCGGSVFPMNVERCWCGHGFSVAVLALLVFAASVAWTPARTDTPVLFSAGLPSSAPVLNSPGTLPAKAILPAGSALPAPLFERLLSKEPSGTFDAGMMVSASVVALRFAQRNHPDFSGAEPYPRHVFLHVYRC